MNIVINGLDCAPFLGFWGEYVWAALLGGGLDLAPCLLRCVALCCGHFQLHDNSGCCIG